MLLNTVNNVRQGTSNLTFCTFIQSLLNGKKETNASGVKGV